MSKTGNGILVIIIIVLVLGNLFFGYNYFVRQFAEQPSPVVEPDLTEGEVAVFLKLFVKKILGAGGEVNFEDRLDLENSIRKIGDQAAIQQWQKFVDSESTEEAQKNIKELLGILVNKL